MTNQSIISRNPLSIAIIIFTVVIALIWLDHRSMLKQQKESPASSVSMAQSGVVQPFIPKAPNLDNSGRTQPKIMDSFGSTGQDTGAAPGLGGLIAGLEAKVTDDPTDVGRRILLAQTYRELNMVEKSLATLRAIEKEFPDNVRARLVMASVLSQRENPGELNEALKLLKTLNGVVDDSLQQYLVSMYEGDAFLGLKKHKKALAKWKLALETMPKGDNRYVILQKRIDELAAQTGGSQIKG